MLEKGRGREGRAEPRVILGVGERGGKGGRAGLLGFLMTPEQNGKERI